MLPVGSLAALATALAPREEVVDARLMVVGTLRLEAELLATVGTHTLKSLGTYLSEATLSVGASLGAVEEVVGATDVEALRDATCALQSSILLASPPR